MRHGGDWDVLSICHLEVLSKYRLELGSVKQGAVLPRRCGACVAGPGGGVLIRCFIVVTTSAKVVWDW